MWVNCAMTWASQLYHRFYNAARDARFHKGRVSRVGFAWCSLCIASLSTTFAFGASTSLDNDGEVILRSMLEARENVYSGSVVVKGKKHLRGGNAEPRDWHGMVSGKVDFDNRKSMLKFEWNETQRTRFFGQNDAERIAADPNSIPLTSFDMGIQYVRNADYAAYCTHDGPTVRSNLAVFEPTRKYITGNTPSPFHRFFDVMACNVIDFEGFRRGAGFNAAYDSLLDLKLEHVEATEDGWNLRLQGAGTGFSGIPPVVEIRLQRDGYVPVEFSWTDEPSGASFRSKGTWKSERGLFVPTSYDFVWDFPEADDHFEFQVEFEWLKVNEELDAKLFDYHCFHFAEIQKGIHVVDLRDPQLPTIEIVGKNGKIESVTKPLATEAHKPSKAGSNSWLVQLNAVFVAVVAFFLGRVRLRS